MWIEILLLTILILALWSLTKKPSNYPPGPWGLPLVGYLPLGRESFEGKILELRKKHGPIFSWRIGSKLLVCITDYKTSKEVFQSQAFADRPNLLFMSMLEDNSIGLAFTNGVHWHNIRRFTLRHLRDLGMGKSKLVAAVQYEAMEIVKVMKDQAGRPAPIPEALAPAVINVIWQMVASMRYDLDDKPLLEFNKLFKEVEGYLANILIQDIFPWIVNVLPKPLLNFITKKNLHTDIANILKKKLQTYIDDHLKTLDVNNPRDFIDEYLIEMGRQKSDPDSTMSNDDLIGCISDLFGAGLETITLTIVWSIFYLINYPSVQLKLQKEIDEALPNGVLVSMEDKLRLPYIEAFINEVLRHASLTVLGIPRTVSTDVIIKGYVIPKDAVVMATTEAIQLDPKYFDSPNEFKPERFINSAGKFEPAKEGFLPFGIGKRQCLGESLARMQLFIFLTTMVQHLSFSAPPNQKVDLSSLDIPIFRQPKSEQDIIITTRK